MPKHTHGTAARRRDQDQIPTVRPPRESWRLELASDAELGTAPLPESLWQLAREVMQAEAREALWGSRR